MTFDFLRRKPEAPDAPQAPRSMGLPDPGVLTERESEVLALLIDGRNDAEIGEALFISPKTVSTHVFAIKGKLGAGSRTEIVAIAFRRGLAKA